MTEHTMSKAEQLAAQGGYTAPGQDPLRGWYGVVSAMLILEVIPTLLAIVVVVKSAQHPLVGVVALVLLSVTLVWLCAQVKKKILWPAIIGIHGLDIILGFYVHYSIMIVGVVFAMAWAYVAYAGLVVQRKLIRGQLAGQKPLLSAESDPRS